MHELIFSKNCFVCVCQDKSPSFAYESFQSQLEISAYIEYWWPDACPFELVFQVIKILRFG